jgi:hypothetical protein
MIDTEKQFSSIPSNEEIRLMEKEAQVEERELREFDRELGA